MVRGVALPGTGVAAALLVDAGSPSSESFWIQLATAPTTASLYSLSLDGLTADTYDLRSLLLDAIDRQDVVLGYEGGGGGVMVPEPSAALVFGVGLLITRSVVRRRSA